MQRRRELSLLRRLRLSNGVFVWLVLPAFLMLALPSRLQAQVTPDFNPETNQEAALTVKISADGQVEQSSNDLDYSLDIDRYVTTQRFQLSSQYLSQHREVKVVIDLAPELASAKPHFYGVHGVENLATRTQGNQLIFTADVIDPGATLTVTLNYPPELFPLFGADDWRGLLVRLTALEAAVLSIFIAFLLFLLTGVIILWRAKDIFLRLPVRLDDPNLVQAVLSPAATSALVYGRIRSQAIAATLLDLARRGYLDIVAKSDGSFGYAQKVDWRHDRLLTAFERLILEQVFDRANLVASGQQIKKNLNREFFSSRISQAVTGLYQELITAGYFQADILAKQFRLRIIAVLVFYGSFAGGILSYFWAAENIWTALLWILGMVYSQALYRFLIHVPYRTRAGRIVAAVWRQRLNIQLKDQTVASLSDLALFSAWLPYAIAIGSAKPFARRFQHLPYKSPNWLSVNLPRRYTTVDILTIVDKIVEDTAKRFFLAKKPDIS